FTLLPVGQASGPPFPQRPQDKQGRERNQPIKSNRQRKDRRPASGHLEKVASQKKEQRSASLGGVQDGVIGGGEFSAKHITAQGREQAINLSPEKQGQGGKQHEQFRHMAKGDPAKNGPCFQ